MPLRIPAKGDQPTIVIYDSLEELQRETGQKICHGFFDAKENAIVATPDSVAHEIGHYLDFKSGKFKMKSKDSTPEEKISARLRNEVVAILFAYAKCGDGGACLVYEHQFIKWINFMRESVERFGPHHDKEIPKLKFYEIQSLADWLTHPAHPWFDKVAHFFRNYLLDEDSHMTYDFLR